MLKHAFIIKEQLCQSFRQLIKAFRFVAKKIGGRGGGPFDPLEASRVKLITIMVFTSVSKSKDQNIRL